MMDEYKEKSPVLAEALNRTYLNMSLRNACLCILTYDIVERKSNKPLTVYSLMQTFEEALDPDAHLGRTNADELLNALVDAGALTTEQYLWMHHVSELVEQEGPLKIDPFLEVARRVVAMQLAAGGRRG